MAQIEIIVGSKKTDTPMIEESKMLDVLNEIGVSWRLTANSAHRHPDHLGDFVIDCIKNGTKVFIGVASMAAALPGAIASFINPCNSKLGVINVVVIGVALSSDEFKNGLDALLAMTRMPPGVPVLAAGIGKSGCYNAAITACQIISIFDVSIHAKTWSLVKKIRESKKPEIGYRQSKKE